MSGFFVIFWVLGLNGVKRHFLQYFSYIVAVSFIGGGNRSNIVLLRDVFHIGLVIGPRPAVFA